MTPMKLKMMGNVLFEGLLVVRGSPTITDTLGVDVIVTDSVRVEIVDAVTLSSLLGAGGSAVQRQLQASQEHELINGPLFPSYIARTRLITS